jgi:hypothetical protein
MVVRHRLWWLAFILSDLGRLNFIDMLKNLVVSPMDIPPLLFLRFCLISIGGQAQGLG